MRMGVGRLIGVMKGADMTCENCGKRTITATFVYCCARATFLPIACSAKCQKALGGVDPTKVADCGEHCACGDCVDCDLAARDKAALKS
jgi:hypothetical protein